jgi:putative hydrolase of the HAD superfamily
LKTRCAKRRVWFFDLDDTLHDASHAIFAAIDTRMTGFVERHLGLAREQADRLRQHYWRRYGATMLGLIRHHDVDPHDFLRATHDFDVAKLLRIERGLARMVSRLPGRKVLMTNAPGVYARQVLRGVGLHRHIRVQYSIERLRLHGHFRPKPSIAMFRAVLAREGMAGRSNAGHAVLVDDSLVNLKAARAAGFSTVLRVGPGAVRPLAGGAYIDARVRSVRQLGRRLS